MNFVVSQPFTDPEAAARKLAEIANGVEAVQDGRINRFWRQRLATSGLAQ